MGSSPATVGLLPASRWDNFAAARHLTRARVVVS